DHSCFPCGLRDAQEGVEYWEDLPQEEKDRHRQLRRDSIARLDTLQYPLRATFDGHPVLVLGRAMDFEPYASHPLKGSRDKDDQMMVERVGDSELSEKFITFAHNLVVDGQPLTYRQPYKLRPRDFLSGLVKESAREDRAPRISLHELAATFLANIEGDGNPYEFKSDPRVETIATTLEALGLRGVHKILGAGTFGTAALLDDETVIKLTSDPTEVQAGAVLRGHR